MSRPLMPCLETVCMDSFANVSLHQIVLFSHFKGTAVKENLCFIGTKFSSFRYIRKVTAWVRVIDASRTMFTNRSSLDLPKASEWLANSVRGCRLK